LLVHWCRNQVVVKSSLPLCVWNLAFVKFGHIFDFSLHLTKVWSRLTGSESQGQEEASWACPANVTTSVLFTATKAVKFPSTVTQSSWALPLSYYTANTFLSCKISKPKMNKLGATIVKNQPFQLLWCLFPYLRLKLYCLDSNSIVTREIIPLFYVESENQHSLQSIQPPLLCSLQYFILLIKNLDWL